MSPQKPNQQQNKITKLKDKKRCLEGSDSKKRIRVVGRLVVDTCSEPGHEKDRYDPLHSNHSVHTTQTSTSTASTKSVIMRRLGGAVGRYVASPVVESMDVTAILNEVDWNEVLDKIDINEAIFDKIDVNRLLDRIDVNRHLDRVDWDQHLDKVNWDAIVEHSNLETIVKRSTSGVLSSFSGLFRTRLAYADQWGQRIGRCYCYRKNRNRKQNKNTNDDGENAEDNSGSDQDLLPPRPGRPEDSETPWENPGKLDSRDFEKQIQFRTTGALIKILYFILDAILLGFAYTMTVAMINYLIRIFVDDPKTWEYYPNWVNSFGWELVTVLSFQMFYTFLCLGCAGRTIAMWILGTLMVNTEGRRISLKQVCLGFFLFFPLDCILFGWVIGFVRRDGAFASNLIVGTRIVYVWDAWNQSKYPNPELAMSLNDFEQNVPEHERQSLLLSPSSVPKNLNVQLGGDDYKGSYDNDDVSFGSNDDDDVFFESNDVEASNLEDGASRWSHDNI